MNRWYQLAVVDDTADLYIYGDITSIRWEESDVTSFNMAAELGALRGMPLNVHINSYGGECAEGIAIYQLLKDYKGEVTTVCDGFACSAASVIFMAGDKRIMHPTSLLMIHNAWTVTDGNAEKLRKEADKLDIVTEPSIKAYVEASHLERDEIKAMMDAETWITAEEALEYGFATAIVDDNEAKQSFKDSVILGLVRKVKELERPAEQSNIDETPSSTGWFFHK